MSNLNQFKIRKVQLQMKLDELNVKYKTLEQRAAEVKGDANQDLDEQAKVAKADMLSAP